MRKLILLSLFGLFVISSSSWIMQKQGTETSKHAVFRQDSYATLGVQAEKIEYAKTAEVGYSALCYAAVAESSSETNYLEKPILKNLSSDRAKERKAFLPELSRTIRKLSYSSSTC